MYFCNLRQISLLLGGRQVRHCLSNIALISPVLMMHHAF